MGLREANRSCPRHTRHRPHHAYVSDGDRMTRLSLPGILRRSLIHRRARSISALIAMTVSAGVATALLTLYADLDQKLHKEFRSFGANIVLTTPANAALPSNALAQVQQIAGPEAIAVPFAYAVATTSSDTPVVVAGVDFETLRRLNPTWQADRWPSSVTPRTLPPPALLGQRAAQFIGEGNSVTLQFNGHPIYLQGSGLLRTGSDEDSRIYIPLEAFTNWTGIAPSVIELQIPGGAKRVEATITQLKNALPEVQVQPVRQLVEGESRIVDRTHGLMYGAVLLIALTVAVSVLATLSASVLERRRDFALMKALGGSQMQLMAMFLLEALILALAGVAAGFVVGSAAAWIISEGNFHTATLPHISVLPMVLLVNLVIATLAALLPLRVLRGLQPAVLLKGE
jgi:putative ABC transport system permease protein